MRGMLPPSLRQNMTVDLTDQLSAQAHFHIPATGRDLAGRGPRDRWRATCTLQCESHALHTHDRLPSLGCPIYKPHTWLHACGIHICTRFETSKKREFRLQSDTRQTKTTVGHTDSRTHGKPKRQLFRRCSCHAGHAFSHGLAMAFVTFELLHGLFQD